MTAVGCSLGGGGRLPSRGGLPLALALRRRGDAPPPPDTPPFAVSAKPPALPPAELPTGFRNLGQLQPMDNSSIGAGKRGTRGKVAR